MAIPMRPSSAANIVNAFDTPPTTRPPVSINKRLLDNMSAERLECLTVALIESETPWTPAVVRLAEYVREEVFG